MAFIQNLPRKMPENMRPAAIGKALLVWLFSGSLGLAIVAFLLFKMIGW